jgi:DNA-binding IclR family transcriptional regulator
MEQPVGRSGGESAKRAAVMAQAAEMDRRVLGLLKDQPMTSGQIAKATASKVSTTSERMRRLERRGLVRRDDDGAWLSQSTQTS